jgi:hypothetical protein
MLQLKDIPLGSTDAKNELLKSTPEEVTRFLDSFVPPPALTVEKFFDKSKYYVVGLKGTGKTALLRYISLRLEEDTNSVSSFVLLKSDIDEDARKDFSKAARVQVIDENSESFEGDDFETVWRWFIYRKIASAIQNLNAQIFQDCSALSSFLELVNSESSMSGKKVGFMRLVPTIRKGNIEISKSPKLGLELQWDDNGKAKVNFNDLVRRADQAFLSLVPDSNRLNLFFDELELNFGNTKQYQRDSRLVRDLVVSIEKINGVCKAKGIHVCVYAAIRSEVLVSVSALGKEINKPIADFGSAILWNRPGLDAAQQPLLQIIEKRINNARAEKGYPILPSNQLWKEYFPDKIDYKKPQVYILHNSWYRPRDIVRLLVSVQDQYPLDTSFILQGLEAVRKSYSTACWVEITEELKAKYRPDEIDGIKYIFYGYKQVSSLSELNLRAAEISNDYRETLLLLERVTLKEILKDLFRIGVIGNIDSRRNMRFSFRGDDEILFSNNIFVHNALRAHLSIFN